MTEEATPPSDDGQGEAWYAGLDLPSEQIGYIQNKGWNDPKDILSAYQNLEKFRGASEDQLLYLPKGPDDKEGYEKVWSKLGRPEKVEDYGEFKMPEGVTHEIDSNRVSWADKTFHELGLTKSQRDALMTATAQYEFEQMKGFHEQVSAAQEAEYEALKKEWGANYAEREELGRRAVRAFLPKDSADELANKIENAIGTAATLKLFANIGDKMGEDKMPSNSTESTRFGYTRDMAAADRKALSLEIQSDKQRLANYNEGKGPDYEKMQRLIKLMTA